MDSQLRTLLVALAAAACSLPAVAVPGGETKLSAAEIVAALAGNTVIGNRRGRP